MSNNNIIDGSGIVIPSSIGNAYSVGTNPDGNSASTFGTNGFDVSGNIAAVAAVGEIVSGKPYAGRVDILRTDTSQLLAQIDNPDPANYDMFGMVIALHGNYLAISTNIDDPNGTSSGSIWIYDLSNPSFPVLMSTLNGTFQNNHLGQNMYFTETSGSEVLLVVQAGRTSSSNQNRLFTVYKLDDILSNYTNSSFGATHQQFETGTNSWLTGCRGDYLFISEREAVVNQAYSERAYEKIYKYNANNDQYEFLQNLYNQHEADCSFTGVYPNVSQSTRSDFSARGNYRGVDISDDGNTIGVALENYKNPDVNNSSAHEGAFSKYVWNSSASAFEYDSIVKWADVQSAGQTENPSAGYTFWGSSVTYHSGKFMVPQDQAAMDISGNILTAIDESDNSVDLVSITNPVPRAIISKRIASSGNDLYWVVLPNVGTGYQTFAANINKTSITPEGARAITVTGDVQQGAFSPYVAGGYSTEISSGYVGIAASSDFAIGADDFTFETWVKVDTDLTGPIRIFALDGATGASSSSVYCKINASSVTTALGEVATSVSFNDKDFHHVAVSRSSGTTNMFVDGVQVSSVTDATSYTPVASPSPRIMNGAGNITLSNMRLVKGVGLYPSAFTPPTEPLTLTNETVLLTCNQPYISAVGNTEQQVATGNSTVMSKIIVSSPTHDKGAVYIYDEDENGLVDPTSEIKLVASGLPQYANFGNAITSMNSKLIVSDQKEGVYIYDLTAGTGSAADILNSQFKITPSISGTQVYFGTSLDVDDNKLVVGAMGEGNIGAVYVYDLTAADINASEIKITPSDGVSGSSRFGFSVYIDSNKVFVGDTKGGSGSGTYTGAAYVYDLTAGNATAINASEIKVTANDPSPVPNYFTYGQSVTYANNKLFVGAISNWNGAPSAVYIYDLTAGNATAINASEIKLQASDLTNKHNFGNWLHVDGNMIAVAAQGADYPIGAVYVYDLTAADINASEIKITPSDGVLTDNMDFGFRVSMANGKLLVGARMDDDAGFQSSGAAYIYDLTAGDATAINNSEIKVTASDIAGTRHFGSAAHLAYAELPEYALQPVETVLASTPSGTVSTERTSPYGFTDYSAASHGGSAVFDGSEDKIIVNNLDVTFTGDYTIEAWVYPKALGDDILQSIITFPGDTQSPHYDARLILWKYASSPNPSEFLFSWADGTQNLLFSTTIVSINQWYHIAISRSSGTTKMFVNGTEEGSTVGGQSTIGSSGDLLIGASSNIHRGLSSYSDPDYGNFTGVISDVRITTNAEYIASFTPPTAPLAAVTGTTLLLPFDDATIVDKSGSGILELKGAPTITTVDSPYGPTYESLVFDGSADYIEIDNDLLEFDDNFTIEAWIKPTASAGQVIELADGSGIKISTISNIPAVDTDAIELWVNGTNPAYNLKTIPAGTTVQYDANSHLYTNYNNGGGAYTRAGILEIGSWPSNQNSAAVVIDFNNSFLHMDNINGSNTSGRGAAFQVYRGDNDLTLKNLNLKISGSSNYWFAIGYEGYGDPSATITFENCTIDLSDWLSESGYLYLNGQSIVFDSNCTIIKNASVGDVMSAYVNYGALTNNGTVVTHTSNEGQALLPLINSITPAMESYEVVFHNGSSNLITSTSSYSTLTWKHVAVSRRSSVINLFVDGTTVGSASSSATIGSEGTAVVGAGAAGSDKFAGLLSDIRISSNNVYYSDFTAPNAPLTLDTAEEYVPYVAPVYNDYAADYVAQTSGQIVTVENAGSTINLDAAIDSMSDGDALLLDAGEYQITTTVTASNPSYSNDILRGKNIAIVGKTENANDVVLTFAGLSKRDTHIFPVGSNYRRHFANVKIEKPAAGTNYSAAVVGGATSSTVNPSRGSCRNVIIDFSGGHASWKYNSSVQTDVLWNNVSFVNYAAWYTSYSSSAVGQTITNCSFEGVYQIENGTFEGTNYTNVSFDSDNLYAESSTSGHLFESEETGTIRVS